jgi:hypothetical protein
MMPAYLGTFGTKEIDYPLCVQGNVEMTRRDYSLLLKLAQHFHDHAMATKIKLVGNMTKADGPHLLYQIDKLGLEPYFEFQGSQNSNEIIGYQDYYQRVYASDFILFLISDALLRTYQNRITSSLTICLALDCIPIVLEKYAVMAGIQDISLTYTDDIEFFAVVERALSMSTNEKQALRQKIRQKRELWLKQSEENLASVIDSFSE